jgi:hypothetical protein
MPLRGLNGWLPGAADHAGMWRVPLEIGSDAGIVIGVITLLLAIGYWVS